MALIVDSHGEMNVTEDAKTPNKDAQNFKETFDGLGFCTLYFNSLSSESIHTLLEMLLEVDHSQLAILAFIVLCKGRTRHLYDCNDEMIHYENIFKHFPDDQSPLTQVPKIFYFHLAHANEPAKTLQCSLILPKNSIVLITSVHQESSSVVLNTVGSKLTREASIQQRCKEIEEEFKGRHDKVSCVYNCNFTEKFVLPAPYKPFHPRLAEYHCFSPLYLHTLSSLSSLFL